MLVVSLACVYSFYNYLLRLGVNSGGSWVVTPTDSGLRVVGVALAVGSGGSWTGREILLQLIVYKKYVRKW